MTRFRPLCARCHEPFDRDGADVCDWCTMAPAERDAHMKRQWLIFAAIVVLLLAAAFLAPAP